MKKLLIFHPTIAPYRIDFFNDLYKAFDTRVCLRYRNLKSQKFDYDKIAAQFAFEPVYMEEGIKIGGRTLAKGFWKNIDEHNPDIVIVEEFSIGAIMVLLHRFFKRKKYKVISTCDDSYNMVAENNDFSKAHKLARKAVVPHLDNIILVERKVAEWYKEKYGKGICFPIIKPDDKARAQYERIVPQSQATAIKNNLIGKKILLFVGRLVAIKNVEAAIRAFSTLNQEENVFVIVGDGPERENLEQVAKELKANTIFTGRLEGDALNEWYNIAQTFILPSYQEAFGAVTNEALLAGCKALISQKAGSQSLVEEGKNGYTFNPHDTNDIADKMHKTSLETSPLQRVVLKENNMQHNYQALMNQLIKEIKEL